MPSRLPSNKAGRKEISPRLIRRGEISFSNTFSNKSGLVFRGGKGLGTLVCLRGTEEPVSADPAEKNLTDFQVVWGDTYE